MLSLKQASRCFLKLGSKLVMDCLHVKVAAFAASASTQHTALSCNRLPETCKTHALNLQE